MTHRTVLMLGALAAGCAHAPPPPTVTTTEGPTSAPARTAPARSAEVAPAPSPASDLDDLTRGAALHFAFDEARLTPESEQRLQRIAEGMRAHLELRLAVAGNCDELGTEEYNLALGQKRAAAAQAYLAMLGIDRGRVTTVSYGKERPVASGHDEQARAQNRRDDLTLQHI